MADIKSPKERSLNMAKIRSKDTKPEVWLRTKLFERGYRYRKYVNTIPGHPDIWIAKYNTAVFVHGCFWHRHEGCKYAYTPKSRVEFWTEKFQKNVERDKVIRVELADIGVRMLIVWECTIKRMIKEETVRENCLKHIDQFLLSTSLYEEI